MAFTTVSVGDTFQSLNTALSELCWSLNERENFMDGFSLTTFPTNTGLQTYPTAAELAGVSSTDVGTILTSIQAGISAISTGSRSSFIPAGTPLVQSKVTLSSQLALGSYGSFFLTSTIRGSGLVNRIKQIQEVFPEYRYVDWDYYAPLTWTHVVNTTSYANFCANTGNTTTNGTSDIREDLSSGNAIVGELRAGGANSVPGGLDGAPYKGASRHTCKQVLNRGRVVGTPTAAQLVFRNAVQNNSLIGANFTMAWAMGSYSGSEVHNAGAGSSRWTTFNPSIAWATGADVDCTFTITPTGNCPSPQFTPILDGYAYIYLLTRGYGLHNSGDSTKYTRSVTDTIGEYTYG